MKLLAALVGGLGLLFFASSAAVADDQYAMLLKSVYSRWNPPSNAQVVKGELSIDAAGQLVGYRFVSADNQTQESLLAAISQIVRWQATPPMPPAVWTGSSELASSSIRKTRAADRLSPREA